MGAMDEVLKLENTYASRIPIDHQMIQIRAEVDGVGDCVILIAINTIIETCVNARAFDDSCGPDVAAAAHD